MKIRIADHPTFIASQDKKEIQHKTEKILMKIGELQNKMYAQNKYSLLIVFQ